MAKEITLTVTVTVEDHVADDTIQKIEEDLMWGLDKSISTTVGGARAGLTGYVTHTVKVAD